MVAASKTAKCVTVPQLAVGAGKAIAAALRVMPPVLSGAVQFASAGLRCTRAYDPPDTSVPPPLSLGAAVKSAIHSALGFVKLPVRKRCLRSSTSR